MDRKKSRELSIRQAIASLASMVLMAFHVHPFSCVLQIFLEAMQGIVPIASAVVMKSIVDQLASSVGGAQVPWQNFGFLLLVLAAITITTRLFDPIGNYLRAELSRRISLEVQTTAYGKLIEFAGIGPFEDPNVHDTLGLGTQGAQTGPTQAFALLSGTFRSVVTLTSFVGVLIMFSPWLTGLVILGALPQLILQVKMGSRHFELASNTVARGRRTGYLAHLLTSARAAVEIRILGTGEHLLSLFRDQTREINSLEHVQQKRELRWQASLGLLANTISSASLVAVILQAFRGNVSIGDVTLFASAVGSVQASLSGIVTAIASSHRTTLFFSKFTELLRLPQPIAMPSHPKPVTRLCSGVEVRGVSFRYSPNLPWVLRDVSFTIPAGSCTAIVGPNGAGKTTLVKLLARMYDPTEGCILRDGIDLRELDPTEYRRTMGATLQDFLHYEMTAFDNIALGDLRKVKTSGDSCLRGWPSPISSDESSASAQSISNRGDMSSRAEISPELLREVIVAAARSGIHEKISILPDGYQTVLSPWLADRGFGVELSGGEWQKIALARLFFRSPDFLILDEPTADLDPEAEYAVYCHFLDMVKGRTSLLITHRLSTVSAADRIVVLREGKLIEQGSCEALFASGGEYSRLYYMQADRYRGMGTPRSLACPFQGQHSKPTTEHAR